MLYSQCLQASLAFCQMGVDCFFNFRQLLCDPIDPEFNGIQHPELKVFNLHLAVYHPDNLQGDQHQTHFNRKQSGQSEIDVHDMTCDIKNKEKDNENNEEDI